MGVLTEVSVWHTCIYIIKYGLRVSKPMSSVLLSSDLFSSAVRMCRAKLIMHYSDVMTGTMASQITSLTDCLLSRLFKHSSKKTSKLRVTGLCEGNSPVTGVFPAQMTSDAENVSIWWRHHLYRMRSLSCCVRNIWITPVWLYWAWKKFFYKSHAPNLTMLTNYIFKIWFWIS